jgi:hypothetical protein
LFTLFFDLKAQLLFRRQAEHVLGGEDLPAVVQNRIARHRFVPFRAENQADGRVIVRRDEQSVVHPHIAVHLTDIRMGQLAHFEVNQQIEFQAAVVKDRSISDPVLPCDMLLSSTNAKPCQLCRKR